MFLKVIYMNEIKKRIEELQSKNVLEQIEKTKVRFANSPIMLKMLEMIEAKAKANMTDKE